MTENIDYKIIPYGEEASAIEILCEPFKGVHYIYGVVEFLEEDDGAKLKFDFNVIGEVVVNETKHNELHKLVGDILIDIISKEVGIDESEY